MSKIYFVYSKQTCFRDQPFDFEFVSIWDIQILLFPWVLNPMFLAYIEHWLRSAIPDRIQSTSLKSIVATKVIRIYFRAKMYIGSTKAYDFSMFVSFAFMFAYMYSFTWYQTWTLSEHSKTEFHFKRSKNVVT